MFISGELLTLFTRKFPKLMNSAGNLPICRKYIAFGLYERDSWEQGLENTRSDPSRSRRKVLSLASGVLPHDPSGVPPHDDIGFNMMVGPRKEESWCRS
jgi:hypothetical protein